VSKLDDIKNIKIGIIYFHPPKPNITVPNRNVAAAPLFVKKLNLMLEIAMIADKTSPINIWYINVVDGFSKLIKRNRAANNGTVSLSKPFIESISIIVTKIPIDTDIYKISIEFKLLPKIIPVIMIRVELINMKTEPDTDFISLIRAKWFRPYLEPKIAAIGSAITIINKEIWKIIW